MHELTCVLHVHSTLSDGTATVPEIIEAASRARADAVLLTDHDSREAARQGHEGWHGDVLLLVGHEITTRRGHLLVFGVEREIDHRGRSEIELCAEVRAQGGVAFAAHPFSRGGAVRWIVRPHPWEAIDRCEDAGVELWSLVTDAAERWRSPRDALRFIRAPETAMDGPPAEHLAQWDALCADRRVPAIGGLDAHQTGLRIGGRVFSPMPNARYFGLLRTHLLLRSRPTGRLAHDSAMVYDALREGRCYLATDALAPGRGFQFFASRSGGQAVAMGGEVRRDHWMMSALVPRPAKLVLFRDGRQVAERDGRELSYAARERGVYRVEARLSVGEIQRRWIISNPIYVR